MCAALVVNICKLTEFFPNYASFYRIFIIFCELIIVRTCSSPHTVVRAVENEIGQYTECAAYRPPLKPLR